MLNPKLREIFIAKETKKYSGIPKEYVLLFLGALISVATTLTVTIINGKFDERKQLTQEKILFADDLCKNIGRRFHIVGSIYNAKLDTNQKELKKWLSRNEAIDTLMYAKTYYYNSRLRILFNKGLAKRFRDSIDIPFDKLEDDIVYSSKEELKKINISERWPRLDTCIHNFTVMIYKDAFNDLNDH